MYRGSTVRVALGLSVINQVLRYSYWIYSKALFLDGKLRIGSLSTGGGKGFFDTTQDFRHTPPLVLQIIPEIPYSLINLLMNTLIPL